MEENALYGLLGASEPYILEYVKGNPVELKGMHTGTVKSEITEFKIFGWSQQTKTEDNKYQQYIQGVGTNGNVIISVGEQETEIEVKLYGIQNDEEPTYIDEFGQGWIADELNLLTGKVIRRVSVEDETKEVQILKEPVEENINVNILDSVIAEGNNTIENNSFAVMEIVYKAYSGGM